MKNNRKKIIIFWVLVLLVLGFAIWSRPQLLQLNLSLVTKNSVIINEVMTNNRNSHRDEDGDIENWIELYNNSDEEISLEGYGLSNNPDQPSIWTFPEVKMEPRGYCRVWASGKNRKDNVDELHTNFTVNNKDSVLIFTSPDQRSQDVFPLEEMEENIACGRQYDNRATFMFTEDGTPGYENRGVNLIGGAQSKKLSKPIFSHEGGFYEEEFELAINASREDAKIYYTIDGSVPTEESTLYTKHITINVNDQKGTVIRARVYQQGYPKSEIVSKTYFVGEKMLAKYQVPVVSIITDPENLFDHRIGIYVEGRVRERWIEDNPSQPVVNVTPANYNEKGKKWERPAHVELFDRKGEVGISQNIGIRINGGYSRERQIKSLSLNSRYEYDDHELFQYDLFEEEVGKWNEIILRTSASDSHKLFFRDAFMQSLIPRNIGLDYQNSRLCIVYINGEYYGIHNIREAYNKEFLANKYGIEEENVVIIKNPTGGLGDQIQEGYVGDEIHYAHMINYINKNSLSKDKNFQWVEKQMDIKNFIYYQIIQIYCDNTDWPGNNVRIWRNRVASYQEGVPYGWDGRWRWMVYDLDHGFGLYEGEKAASHNTLAMALETDGPDWPNPPWSTQLLRGLLENEGFKQQFINTFADWLNTCFREDIVVAQLDEMADQYAPYIEEHISRWGFHKKKVENWWAEVEVIRGFAQQRPKYMRQYIMEQFELEGDAKVTIEIEGPGKVVLNTLTIDGEQKEWSGVYFQGIPISLEAIPSQGSKFIRWEGEYHSTQPKQNLSLQDDVIIKAIFADERR